MFNIKLTPPPPKEKKKNPNTKKKHQNKTESQIKKKRYNACWHFFIVLINSKLIFKIKPEVIP